MFPNTICVDCMWQHIGAGGFHFDGSILFKWYRVDFIYFLFTSPKLSSFVVEFLPMFALLALLFLNHLYQISRNIQHLHFHYRVMEII